MVYSSRLQITKMSTREGITNELSSTYTIEYCVAVKMNEVELCALIKVFFFRA